MNLEKSSQLYNESKKFAPAGVHSPVRAFKSVGGTPLFFEKGQGAYLTDVDGNKYVDFCMSWGALILGHAHTSVVEGIKNQVAKGTHFGTPTALDVELASLILSKLPFYQKMRFVNSGTEAVMTAIRLARGATGRSKIIKIDGAYHGHVDSLLVSGGSGLMTFGQASSQGVTQGTVQDTIIIPYNDKEALLEVFALYPNEIAGVILEPIMANSGLFVPEKDWIHYCRDITKKYGALLIFDEVITGFRVGAYGAAGYYDVTPDIGTYGKIIGGGLPVGAICASEELMNYIAPNGGVYQAGTLSGNPLCMISGIKTVSALFEENVYDYIDKKIGPYLDQKIQELKQVSNYPFHYQRVGSVFWLCPMAEQAPKSYHDISIQTVEFFKGLYHHLLSKGVYFSPSVYEVSFLSSKHTEKEIDTLIEGLKSYRA